MNSQTINPHQEKYLLLTLALVQFAHIVDFMVMMPLGPQLERVLGITPQQFGLLVSSYMLSAAFFGVICSALQNRFEKKIFLISIFTGFTLATLLCGLSFSYLSLLLARIVAGAFGGILNAQVYALIADLIPEARRGEAMGTVMTAMPLSAVFGVPLSLALSGIYDWRAPFLFLALVSVAGLVCMQIFLPIMPRPSTSTISIREQIKAIFINPVHQMTFLFSVLLVLSVFLVIPFISMALVANWGISESDLAYVYLAGGCVTIFSSRWFGRMADRFGRLLVFQISVPLTGLSVLILTHGNDGGLLLSCLAVTFFMSINSGRMVCAQTMITTFIKPHLRGSFLSMSGSITQIASGFGSLIAGSILYKDPAGHLHNFDKISYLALGFMLLSLVMARMITRHLKG